MLWSPRAAVSIRATRMSKAGQDDAALRPEQAHAALGVSAEEFAAFLRTPICMLVPSPLLLLIAKGSWHALLTRAHLLQRKAQSAVQQLHAHFLWQYPSRVWQEQLRAAGRLHSHMKRQI